MTKDMMKKNKKIYSPELFQGKKQKPPYFEGWYFKHVSADKQHFLVAIPGVSLAPNDEHCFIQVFFGKPFQSFYIRYDLDAFKYNDNTFDIHIGDSHFSEEGISLNIDDKKIKLSGTIRYSNFKRIKKSALAPSIMGYYAYIKNMQCNHGVISLDHTTTGSIKVNGKTLDFNAGRGYVEKDWGSSFPQKYLWIQGNHFLKDESLIVSIARVPFLGLSFLGLISIFTLHGYEYRFATYNGAKFKFDKTNQQQFSLTLSRKNIRLEVEIEHPDGLPLKAPKQGMMIDEITETLEGKAAVKLYINNKLEHETVGDCVGVELVNFP